MADWKTIGKVKSAAGLDTKATVSQLVNNAGTLHKNAGDKTEACEVCFADHG